MFVVLYANDCMKRELTVKKISQMVSADINCFESGGSWCGKITNSAKQIIKIPDVRKPGEYEAEHIENVPSTPLDFINEHLAEFPKEDDFYIHCAGGYRSVIAASILKSRGYHNVIDVKGGYAAIKNTGIKRTNFVCPSTLKS